MTDKQYSKEIVFRSFRLERKGNIQTGEGGLLSRNPQKEFSLLYLVMKVSIMLAKSITVVVRSTTKQ